MRQGHRDPSEGIPAERPTLTRPAALVWGVPAHTLPGLAPERPPQPQPPRAPTTGQRSLQGGMVVSRPWGSEGQPVPPPLAALCPKVKGTRKQAGPLSRLASGQGVLSSGEPQAGKAAGLETSPVCTGRARHSRGVGGPRQGQTQPVDMPPRGPGMGNHTAIPGPSHGHPQVGSELCTSLRGDIPLRAIPHTLISAPPAPGVGPPSTSFPGPGGQGPEQGGPTTQGTGSFRAARGPESAPHPPST